MSDSLHGKCSRCGERADRIASGMPECDPCWNWRKLDYPAASHWAKVAAEFLSNVDMYDYMTYLPACGLTREEATLMITAAAKVRDHSDAIKKGPPHVVAKRAASTPE